MAVAAGIFVYHITQDDRGFFYFNPSNDPQWRGPYDSVREVVEQAVCPDLVDQVDEQFTPPPTQQ